MPMFKEILYISRIKYKKVPATRNEYKDYIHTWVKYFNEYWYIGSISASCATTKYSTDPLVATERYFSRAIEIFSSVASVSINLAAMIAEVSYAMDH